MEILREAWVTLKETAQDWVDDNASRLAAALAYYSLLSLAPLLVITVAVAGVVFGADAARGRLSAELGTILGHEAAEGMQAVMASARSPESGIVSTLIGIVTLFIGASGMFAELQAALNTVWEVETKPGRPLFSGLRARFLSFAMVIGVAFLLLISLVLSAVLGVVGKAAAPLLPGGEIVWQVANFGLSFAVVTGLFALVFKYVPDVEIRWADVWIGAAVTALLFTFGKLVLGLYLGHAAVGSSYGAAGSLIVLVVWVYYAAQILFFGAEFTQVQARRRGRDLRPARNAVRIGERAAQPASAPSRRAEVSGPPQLQG